MKNKKKDIPLFWGFIPTRAIAYLNVKIKESDNWMFLYMTLVLLFLGTGQVSFAQCQCTPIASNLVVNGGFEDPCTNPMTSFTSEMTMGNCNPDYLEWEIGVNPNGFYIVGTNPNAGNDWTGTPRTGNSYFVGDGVYASYLSSDLAWIQYVNVVAGNRYRFTAWYREETLRTSPLSLEIDGSPIVVADGGVEDQWLSVCGTYIASSTGTVQLGIRRYVLGYANGTFTDNDFGLDDIEFVQIPFLEPVLNLDQTICKGNSATLTASVTGGSGNYSYLWNTGATTSQIIVSPSVTTSYTVTITDNETNCVTSAHDAIQVKVIDMTLELGSDVTLCSAGATNIPAYPKGGSGNYSYLWNTGSTANNINVNYGNPGLYSVAVTDNVYGCTVTDNVTAAPYICQGIKYFQNTQSLPSLNYYNNIVAGRNVDPNQTQGDVVVLNGQNVTFRAAASIILQDGFRVDPGGVFLGEIVPGCYLGNVSISNEHLSYCTYALTANAEFGSGNYSYLWNTGETTKQIIVSPDANTTYSVQITDKCTGSTSSATYNLVIHFKGGFSFAYPNLVTPNGDGYNDRWVLSDNGKTQYAFNAYQFYLEIYNSWGGRVWSQSGTASPTGTGFQQGDIYWDPNSPYVSDGIYYGSVSLRNCDQADSHLQVVVSNGWIQVLRSLRTGVTSDTSQNLISQNIQTNIFEVSPNPSSGVFNYYTNASGNEIQELNVLNMYGTLILSQTKETVNSLREGKFDLSSCPDGIYFIQYKTKNGSGVKKIILTKN